MGLADDSAMSSSSPYTLFFDGDCNLCNTTVDQFLRWDKGSDPVRIKFASLQSEQARVYRHSCRERAAGDTPSRCTLAGARDPQHKGPQAGELHSAGQRKG